MAYRKREYTPHLTWVLASILSFSCGDKEEDCARGTEGCECYPNATCNEELACFSNLCVDPDDKPGPSHNGDGGSSEGETNGRQTDATGDTEGNNGTGPNQGTESGGPDGTNGPGPANSSDPDGTNDPDDTATVEPGQPPANSPVGKHGQLRVSGTQLVDENGTPVQLKGVSSMWLNWENDGYAEDKEGLRYMRDTWNLSLIRAAMGIETSDDSPTYLRNPEHAKAQVEKIVANAIELGVYVIIDWHDHEAIAHQSQAQTFFAEMAAKYKNVPNVLYEVFNEPDQGREGTDEMRETWADLRVYHAALRDTIREHDPDNIILLGTPNWDQDVDVAAESPVSGDNLMYTLHFYSCTHTRARGFMDKGVVALNAGLPLFVSEWGAATADGIDTDSTCIAEAGAWHDWMDENMISWAAWKFDNCDDATCFFVDDAVPTDGNWTDEQLNGLHPQFAIQRMKNEVVVEPGPGPGPSPTCTPSGTCAAGDAMDCDGEGELVSRDCSACALLPSETYCGQVTHFGAVSQPTFTGEASLVQSFTADAESATLNMSFDFTAFPSAYEQVGAIAFELSDSFTVDPFEFTACVESSDPEYTQVSLESGANGCLYYMYVYAFDEAVGCSPALIAEPDYGTCWGAWQALGSPEAVTQINVRIGSQTSGAEQLVVHWIDW